MRYGYARVSTDDQDCTIQRESLQRAGCEVIREEKASGASRQGRDELQLILDFIRADDVLVVTKLDRLARNTVDTLEIIHALGRRGVKFLSLAEPWADTTTPAGELMLTIFAGVAQFERARIKERQAEGIARARERGIYKGRKPSVDSAAIRALEAQGIGASEIARRLKCSRASVYRALGGGERNEADHVRDRRDRSNGACAVDQEIQL